MAAHKTIERFDSNGGLDLKSSDISRNPKYASSMLNAQYRSSGAAEKRRGYQCHSDTAEGFGIYTYKRIDENGLLSELVLSVGRSLRRKYETNLNVAYSGLAVSSFLSLYFDVAANEYKCKIVEGTTEVLNYSLGQGIDAGSPVTITTLAAQINALAGFAATITGDGSVPAAYLKIVRDYDVALNQWDGKAAYWSVVNSPITNPFNGSYTRRNNTDFENVSSVNLSNLIYFSNGFDEVLKYDGQNLYRAGVPLPASLASALAAGGVTGSNYFHKAQYVQVDAVENIVEGNILAVTAGLSPAGQSMDVTVANIQASTGFNTNAAMVVGAQVGVTTINVDNGAGGAHTLKIGDTAYFLDAISGGYVERPITAIGANTITISGAAVTVADNAPISNNLRIKIMRNKTSAITPTVFYTVVELPNNPFTATQVYNDNIADASLGALVEPPVSDRSPPPKGKYLMSFQNLLFIGNLATNKRGLAWSDIDGPEYFPSDTNQDTIEAGYGDEISGIGNEGSFASIFSNTSTFVGSGTFGDGNYRIDLKAANIGCGSHSSITRVEGFLTWVSDRGMYKMTGGQIPTPIGEAYDASGKPTGDCRISPIFDQLGYEFNPALQPLFYRIKRCVSINWLKEGKLLFFLPCESLSGSDRYANSNSRVFAYDYNRDAWLEWDNLDMTGGACLYQDEFYFKSRRLSSGGTIKSDLFRMHNLNDAYDYQDNLVPIDWQYAPQWEHLGEPGVLKTFLEILVYCLEQIQNNSFALTVEQEMNFISNAPMASFNLALTGSGYGQSAYGTDPYGDSAPPKFKHELARLRSTATRVIFKNEVAHENCVVSGWEILYATPYRTEFKK